MGVKRKSRTKKQRRAIAKDNSSSTYKRRDESLLTMGFLTYAAYLESPLWKSIRKLVLERCGKCCACGLNASQVHHTTYAMAVLEGTDIGGLLPICAACHHRIEFRKDGSKCSLQESNVNLDKLRGKQLPSKVIQCANPQGFRKRDKYAYLTVARCIKCKCTRKRKAFRDGICGVCRNEATLQRRAFGTAPRKPYKGDVPQCSVCNCWRVTAKVDGICSVCKRRNAEKNLDTTAVRQEMALGSRAM